MENSHKKYLYSNTGFLKVVELLVTCILSSFLYFIKLLPEKKLRERKSCRFNKDIFSLYMN